MIHLHLGTLAFKLSLTFRLGTFATKFCKMKRTNLLIACLVGPLLSFAATVTWDGGGDGTSWSDPLNWSPNGIPTNADDVTITNASVVLDFNTFVQRLSLAGTTIFTVDFGDTLTLGNTTGTILELSGASNFNLGGRLLILGNATDLTRTVNVNTTGAFTVANGASMAVIGFEGMEQEAIGIESGTFTNGGNLTLSSGSYGITDHGSSSFVNASTGTITMLGIDWGISYDNAGATFTNNGSISISPSEKGILLSHADNVLNNNGSMFISTADTMIYNGGSGSFRNNTGGTLKTVGSGNIGVDRFVNNGGKLSPGASPGFMRFSGSEDFTNSIWDMEIADNDGVPGTDYDQVLIQNGGTATLGNAVLNIRFDYTPLVGQTYKIINASTISGTFSAINVTPAHTVSFDYGTGELTVQSLLPVELVSFKAYNKERAILLTWRTASEIDNDGFEIMRSADGKNWEDLAFVHGLGSSAELHDYSFLDEKPLSGVNYYRLRQIDYDRNLVYSHVVTATAVKDNIGVSFYPNPVNQGFATLFLVSESVITDGILEVFDQLGKNIWHQEVPSSGTNKLSLPLDLTNCAPGIYTLCLKFLDNVMTEQFEVIR